MAVAVSLCHFNIFLIAARLKLLSYVQSSFILLIKTVFIGMFLFSFCFYECVSIYNINM